MLPSIRIPIEEPSQTAEARRVATRMARDMGFDEVRAGEVAIVITEACTNILKHAERGEVLLRVADNGGDGSGRDLELLALDRGPGMRNIEQCLRDGYTTASSPGQGLGAILRLSKQSDIYSVPGEGTAILARWPAPDKADQNGTRTASLRVGAVNVCKRGEEVCGDSWGIEQNGAISTVLVADGLGHGYEASLASGEAVRTLQSNPDLPPGPLLELSHRALRSFRGAAVAVARVDLGREKVTFAGVGNVAAQIYGGSERSQHLVSVNGTAGHHTQRIREFTYPWPSQGMLVLHSDGLSTSAGLDSRPALARHDPSLIAGVLYRDFSRGMDDATVIVARTA